MTRSGIRAGTMLFALLLASILSLIAAPVSQGQASNAPMPIEGTTLADDQQQSPGSSGLLEKAEQEGSVRVMVHLRTSFVPEGRLSRPEVANQRAEIESAQAGLQRDLQGTGYQTLREYDTIPFIALDLSPQSLQAAQRSPHVSDIVEDRPVPPALAESVPKVQAPTMWNSGYTGAGQTVAVLDTGVDKAHPFLSSKVVEEACYSARSNCPNGSTTQTGAGSGVHCTYAPLGCRHGTHVAGIAAGKGTNFSGVAKGANLMAVQVFSRFTGADCTSWGTEDPCTLSYTSDQIAGLERVYNLRSTRSFSSVNMSLGGGRYFSNCDTDPRKAIIDNLRSVRIPTVISSMNNSYTDSMGAPACISSAVSVGSTTKTDALSSFSNSASFLSLLAPGTSIYSSVPGGGYAYMNGTSMAAPHVAGAWALLKQKTPTASVDSVLSALKKTGTPVKDTRVANGVTKPRINIAAAASYFGGPTGTIKINAGSAATNKLTTNLTLSATDPDGVAQMRFHNDSGSWTAWEPYATTKTWTLRNAQGIRTVFVQYKDTKGNVSGETAIKDTIEYDTVSPLITTVTPARGSHNVPLGASVNITFNDDMNTSTLTNNNVFMRRYLGGTSYEAVPAAVTYYASSKTVVLNPVNNLVANGDYVVSVLGGPDGGGVKDTAGNEIDQDTSTPGTQGTFWHMYTD